MGLPPLARRHFAEQHIDRATGLLSKIDKKLAKETEERERTNERFYNNLALFSGGTVALSVTFLGYLKALPKPVVHHPRWLIASWALLLVCLACSLFYTFFVSRYGHYYRHREYCEVAKKRYETEVREIAHLNLANVRTEEELAAYRNPRIEAAAISEKNAKWNEVREKRYERSWIWAGILARTGFLLGLAFLLAFAVANM